MNKEKIVPKIRFKEFSNNWVKCELGEVSDISSGGTPSRGESSYWNGDIPWATTAEVKYSEITDTKEKITIDGLNNSSAKLMPVGTILLAMYGQGKTRGQLGILSIEAATNQANANIQVHRYIYNYFVYYQLVKKYNLLRNLANEGGQANLSLGIVKSVNIVVTNNLDEQLKIGEFFKQLDNIITLQQQLLNDHKQLKKAMLQKMFPQKGESIPKIRFAGFTQKWENLKLSSLYVKGASGGTPKSTNKSYYIGNIPFLGISDISASNGYIYDTKKRISQEGLDSSSAWLVPKEAISLAMYASVGKVAILKTDVATSQAFYNMIFKDIATRNFIFQYLLKKESTNGWNKLISTGTQANLNAKKIQDLQIMVPSLEEQEKIGDLFGKLDKTITLHEKKLETYQNLKKAMLQKMFV
ncbi:HsdS specificity protein of type I restriction-modification system [Carnobacterium sp. AT7]|uniref:restriction endonuclease subunit S n=1 Tax=Carnobacterium sp. AT7 TaxID=333990 RepID=UPI00015F2E63|nr:restriction endonuclease subunit S [Carnobacterium sp. AT7]EDP68171.1 HsdS specificity protein of type I restriction-modification system [Carnobacterium sp. AT7]